MMIILTIAVFLLILTVLVVAHEWGHFITARLFGVRVDEFAIGFPPRALKIKLKNMILSINWLPLGGFVRLKGEQGEDAMDSDSFAAKPIWQRLIILSAGVGMNIILAVVLFCIGFNVGMPVDLSDYTGNGTIQDRAVVITQVMKDTPASKAELKPGDRIITINGTTFSTYKEVTPYLESQSGQTITMVVHRGKDDVTLSPTIETISFTSRDEQGNEVTVQKPGLGVALTDSGIVSYSFFESIPVAFTATGIMIYTIVTFLIHAFQTLVFSDFSGPVGIAAYTGVALQEGFSYIILLMVQLSLSLAILNILPFPALDGGRALFAIIEKLRGKPLPRNAENIAHLIGFALLMLVAVLATIKDIRALL